LENGGAEPPADASARRDTLRSNEALAATVVPQKRCLPQYGTVVVAHDLPAAVLDTYLPARLPGQLYHKFSGKQAKSSIFFSSAAAAN
jgi:hypothetical protein